MSEYHGRGVVRTDQRRATSSSNVLSNPDRRHTPAGNAVCGDTVLLQARKADLHGLGRSITTRLEPDSIWRQIFHRLVPSM